MRVEQRERRFRREGAARSVPKADAGRRPAENDGRELVVWVIGEHASSLLGTARRYSLCPDDAYDAYQRALEILLRRASTLDRTSVLPWLRTVIKHEALAVRAARQPLVSATEPELDQHEDVELPTDEERIARFDRATRTAEALQRLKPHELTALVLKAEGHSYEEIAARTGWTYTKVNRCITEGRRRFIARYTGIESGAECERWQPLLSAVADGEASAGELLELRPHLRRCAACRATVREHHGAGRRIAALLPLGALPALAVSATTGPDRPPPLLARIYEALTGGLHERASVSAGRVQAAVETASTGKLAAVAASTAALAAGGGLAVQERLEAPRHVRPAEPRRVAVRHHRRAHRPRVETVADAHVPIRVAAPPRRHKRARGAEPPARASAAAASSHSPATSHSPSSSSTAPASSSASSAPASPPSRDFAPEQSAPRRTASAPAASSSPAPRRRSSSSTGSSGEFGP